MQRSLDKRRDQADQGWNRNRRDNATMAMVGGGLVTQCGTLTL